jgi:hypothetical protein
MPLDNHYIERLIFFVQTALALQAEETGLFFRHPRFPLRGSLHITD